jgi:hypothetical protein
MMKPKEKEHVVLSSLQKHFQSLNRNIRLEKLEFSPYEDQTISRFFAFAQSQTPFAYAAISSGAAIDLVERNGHLVQQAKEFLSNESAKHCLSPLCMEKHETGFLAIYTYCQTLSNQRLLWPIQRFRLRKPVLQWLFEITKESKKRGKRASEHAEHSLNFISSQKELPAKMREEAEDAIASIKANTWQPNTVLMHGDIWKENILLHPKTNELPGQNQRFTVIDWGGSTSQGFSIYDLIRFALSFKLSNRKLGAELTRYKDCLSCTYKELSYTLLCALGYLGINREDFPLDRWRGTAIDCFKCLEEALRRIS